MAIFIDTGIFTGAYNIRDRYHQRAKSILIDIIEGKYGQAYTSDYIFDEAITLTLYKTKNIELAIKFGECILGSTIIELVHTSTVDFENAWSLFKKLRKQLSFTDCISLAIIKRLKIDYIASFDSDFDGLVERIS
ncbi:MAG: type II toxin-antitoxin system VapC family toxin [Candidatus Odinarchaeota archaeon]|nr:type II toxin-antitoxin system VapC family toxin [Candidatus Odinarchaeota archaeon]